MYARGIVVVMVDRKYAEWFKQATGYDPYPFQVRFACERQLPELVHVPTGLGKTAMAVLGWLWRRQFHPDETIRQSTPRRLVYCLPMRVLVEQTTERARQWIASLKKANCLNGDVPVQLLMGGEEEEDWDLYPERDQIIVGTQDMLLSRALNRGYGVTRSRWPMKFGLLNTDCLWVFDEIQLMGAGLATTAQLEALRRLLPDKQSGHAKRGHGCRSVWMSATLQQDWLKTVDFEEYVECLAQLNLTQDDHGNVDVVAKCNAKKLLTQATSAVGAIEELAGHVLGVHESQGLATRTIVILNTVKRACDLFQALKKLVDKQSVQPELVLLHSRFRPDDRKSQIERALQPPKDCGTIIVSTQVIEAGVDISATTLFTEVAPWASLVQRFGRCNRYGEQNDKAKVFWVALPSKETELHKVAAPYRLEDLTEAERQLSKLNDVGIQSLSASTVFPFEHTHVIRRKDVIELFDTTPDLAGNDIDVDRFVRHIEESDAQVFWRDYGETPNKMEEKEFEPMPTHEELCPVPVGEFRQFVEEHEDDVWRWNFLESRWDHADSKTIFPGQVYLVNTKAGGYNQERGWDRKSKEEVPSIRRSAGFPSRSPDANDSDPLSQASKWQTIAEHTNEVWQALDKIIGQLGLDKSEGDALRLAGRWHDRGKAHTVFQSAIASEAPVAGQPWAKAPADAWQRYCRRRFRHELASALAVLDPRNDLIPEELRDLVAYLVASHHGKVRLSIRSLPNETRPNNECRFARGVWDDDVLPQTNLGGGVVAPEVRLSLEPMELGLCQEPPYADCPSWAERMLLLRDHFGPFRLAYLEAVLRAADMRVSRTAGAHEASAHCCTDVGFASGAAAT